MRIFIVVLAMLTGLSASADILFVNMNDHVEEIDAAEAAAKARGEKLIIIPNLTRKTITQLRRLQDDIEYKNTQLADAKGEKRQAILDDINGLIAKKKKLEPNMRKENLEKEIASLKSRTGKGGISTVVLSGHDGSGHFFGINGSLTASELREMFSKNPAVFTNTHGLFLAGCYTGKLGELENQWKGLTPNLNLVVGYDQRAPLGNVDSGVQFLKSTLEKESILQDAQTPEELQKAFKSLKYAKSLGAVVAVYCNGNNSGSEATSECDGGMMVDSDGAVSMSETMAECNAMVKDPRITKWSDTYNCYIEAVKPECANPPKDTGAGLLRQVYGEVQEYSRCEEIWGDAGIYLPPKEYFINLIFHREVMRNNVRINADELGTLAKDLKELGIPFDLQTYSNEGPEQRKNIIKMMTDARVQIDEKVAQGDVLVGPNGKRLVRASELLANQEFIMTMSSDCVPPDWIDPGASTQGNCSYPRMTVAEEGVARDKAYLDSIKAKLRVVKRTVAEEQKVSVDEKTKQLVWTDAQKALLAEPYAEIAARENERILKNAESADRGRLQKALQEALQCGAGCY